MKMTKNELKALIKECLKEELNKNSGKRPVREARIKGPRKLSQAHFPKNVDEWDNDFSDALESACKLEGWDSSLMLDAIEYGDWNDNFEYEAYADAAADSNRRGTGPQSLEDYLINVCARVVDSGDYDAACDDCFMGEQHKKKSL